MTADGVHQRFDRGARVWNVMAWETAQVMGHRHLATGHCVVGMLWFPQGTQVDSPGRDILTRLGGDPNTVYRHAAAVLGSRQRRVVQIADIPKRVKRGPTATAHTRSLLAALLADSNPSAPITTAHILLALTHPKHPDPPVAGSRDRFGLRRNAVPSFYDIGQRLLDAFAPVEAIHQAARDAVDALDAAFAAGEDALSGESTG